MTRLYIHVYMYLERTFSTNTRTREIFPVNVRNACIFFNSDPTHVESHLVHRYLNKLNHCPLGAKLGDWYIDYASKHYPEINARTFRWWRINISSGNGLLTYNSNFRTIWSQPEVLRDVTWRNHGQWGYVDHNKYKKSIPKLSLLRY